MHSARVGLPQVVLHRLLFGRCVRRSFAFESDDWAGVPVDVSTCAAVPIGNTVARIAGFVRIDNAVQARYT